MLRTLTFSLSRVQIGLVRSIRREFSSIQLQESRDNIRLPSYSISTVVPSELTSNHWCDLSGLTGAILTTRKTNAIFRYGFHGERFPNKTHGFFYYHTPHNGPLIAGGIRFRVCPSDDPKTFQDGFDVLGVEGVPWEISDWTFVLDNNFHSWGKEMIPRPKALERWKKLTHSKKVATVPRNQPLIYSLRQPFPMLVGPGRKTTRIWVANDRELGSVALYNEITTWYDGRRPKYRRFAHVCFDKEGDNVVLRLLSTPQTYAAKMKYDVGYTTSIFPYRPTIRQFPASSALDIIKNFTYTQPQAFQSPPLET